jgi:hypothetical protein
MARKSPKKSKSLFDKQSTKGGWQISNTVEHKKYASVSFLLFLFLVIGITLIAGSFLLSSGEKIISISSSDNKSDNNGKIVHVTGELDSSTFKDPMFQISHTGIGLNRIVEIYQWVESEGAYNKEWKNEIVVLQNNSAAAEGHSNPSEMPFFSESWKVDKIKFGTFEISESLQKKIISYKPIELTQDDFAKLNEHGQKAFKLFEGKYFFGLDPNLPNIGDLRVSFEGASADKYTILAKQQGGTLTGYSGDSGLIEEARLGVVDLKSMSSALETSDNTLLQWILRVAGGVFLLLSAIVTIFGKKKTLTNMNSLKPAVHLPNANPYKTEETRTPKEPNKPVMENDNFSNYDDEFAEEITPDSNVDNYNAVPAISQTASVDSFESGFQSPKNFSANEDGFTPYNSEGDFEVGVEVIGADDFYQKPSTVDNANLNSVSNHQDYNIPDRIEIVGSSNEMKSLSVPETFDEGAIDWQTSEIKQDSEMDDFQIEEIIDLPHPKDFQTAISVNPRKEGSPSVMDFVSKNSPQEVKESDEIEIALEYKINEDSKP